MFQDLFGSLSRGLDPGNAQSPPSQPGRQTAAPRGAFSGLLGTSPGSKAGPAAEGAQPVPPAGESRQLAVVTEDSRRGSVPYHPSSSSTCPPTAVPGRRLMGFSCDSVPQSSLPQWENAESSDDESDGRMAQGTQAASSAGPTWSPFLAEGDAHEDEPRRRTNKPPQPARGLLERRAVESGGPHHLQSYEEQVLGIRAASAAQERGTGTGASDEGAAGSEARAAEHSSEEDVDEDEYRKQLKEAARKDGLELHQLPLDVTEWSLSPGVSWTNDGNSCVLRGSTEDLVAIFNHPSTCFTQFDYEAEVQLVKGDYGGLVFRADGGAQKSQYYAVFLDKEEQKVKLLTRKSSGKKFYEDVAPVRGLAGHWHTFRVRAMGNSVTFYLDHKQIGMKHLLGFGDQAGYFGVWSSDSIVKSRGMIVTSLHKFMDRLRGNEGDMLGEDARRMQDQIEVTLTRLRSNFASRLIQEVTRNKLALIQQRMKQFKDAEQLHRDNKLREHKLWTWMALLAVFKKFDKAMRSSEIWEKKSEKLLKDLDKTDPPPPAPPKEDPPSENASELHERYDMMKRRFEEKRQSDGRSWLGEDRFDQSRAGPGSSADGSTSARSLKSDIARRYREEALQASSEILLRQQLQSAECLENDWRVMDMPETHIPPLRSD